MICTTYLCDERYTSSVSPSFHSQLLGSSTRNRPPLPNRRSIGKSQEEEHDPEDPPCLNKPKQRSTLSSEQETPISEPNKVSSWVGLFRRQSKPGVDKHVVEQSAGSHEDRRSPKDFTADSEPSTPRMVGSSPRAAAIPRDSQRPSPRHALLDPLPTLRRLSGGLTRPSAQSVGARSAHVTMATPRASPQRKQQRESSLQRMSRLLGEEPAPTERVSRRAVAERGTAAQARAAVTYAKPLAHLNDSSSGPDVSASSTSFQPQQAMRLAQMEKYIRKNALQVTFRDTLSRAERREVVTSEQEAKKLAFYLFWNVKSDYARSTINEEDLRVFFLSPRDARLAFELLDADGDGVITAQDVCQAILGVFRERQNLAASLIDTKSVVASLETMIAVVLHIIMAFLYLVIFGVNVLNFYLTFSSMILAFSFVFSNSLKLNYENAVFLFVIHPYDVGDYLLIDGDTCRVRSRFDDE